MRHNYQVSLQWTGNHGEGTSDYRSYSRDHILQAGATGAKPEIPGSSDPAFRGSPNRWNPEELLVASLAACHQLWYLHLCAINKVSVLEYSDDATGVMEEQPDGAGQFREVLLRPTVEIRAGDDAELARRLHDEAHRLCFIARSVSFPVRHEPEIKTPE